jgi:hypothetical protein
MQAHLQLGSPPGSVCDEATKGSAKDAQLCAEPGSGKIAWLEWRYIGSQLIFADAPATDPVTGGVDSVMAGLGVPTCLHGRPLPSWLAVEDGSSAGRP